MNRDILKLPKVAPRTSRNVHFLREGKCFWRKALRYEISLGGRILFLAKELKGVNYQRGIIIALKSIPVCQVQLRDKVRKAWRAYLTQSCEIYPPCHL